MPNQKKIHTVKYNIFKGNKYKYILKGVTGALRYKVARALRTKEAEEVAFVLEAIYKMGGVCRYPKVF